MIEKGIGPPPRFERNLTKTLADAVFYLTQLDVWFRALRDAFAKVRTFELELAPSLVGATTTSEQSFIVPGLAVNDIVYVNKPSHDAGLGIVGCRVSAADTLRLTFMNTTGGGLTPATETYLIVAIRR